HLAALPRPGEEPAGCARQAARDAAGGVVRAEAAQAVEADARLARAAIAGEEISRGDQEKATATGGGGRRLLSIRAAHVRERCSGARSLTVAAPTVARTQEHAVGVYVSRFLNFIIASANATTPMPQRTSECTHSSRQPAPRRITPRAASISHVVGKICA